jgi:hypothetical protein
MIADNFDKVITGFRRLQTAKPYSHGWKSARDISQKMPKSIPFCFGFSLGKVYSIVAKVNAIEHHLLVAVLFQLLYFIEDILGMSAAKVRSYRRYNAVGTIE